MVVKHLPPTVKQLLTLRHPQLPPAPPVSKLSAVLRSTYDDARTKRAENGWLTLAASTPPTDTHLMVLAPADRAEPVCADLHAPHRERAVLGRVPLQVRDARAAGRCGVASQSRRGGEQGGAHARVCAEELHLRWRAEGLWERLYMRRLPTDLLKFIDDPLSERSVGGA